MTTHEVHSGIHWLGDQRCHERSLVGGKAAGLSVLAGRYAVPPGFCIDADRILSAGSSPGLDPGLRAAVEAAWMELARRTGISDPAVAVRSSAADEDGCDHSYAGQYETYLNLTGHAAILEAIERCVAAAGSERVKAYRREHGNAEPPARMAILIQHLIAADVAAVAFSANPLTGARDEVVINASWGLGESIVGGTVSPDSYRVSKRDGTVITATIADKRRMTVLAPSGTVEVDVPRILRDRPSLDEEGAVAIARLAIALEEEIGRPADIECAFADGALALLQCRPITALGA